MGLNAKLESIAESSDTKLHSFKKDFDKLQAEK